MPRAEWAVGRRRGQEHNWKPEGTWPCSLLKDLCFGKILGRVKGGF